MPQLSVKKESRQKAVSWYSIFRAHFGSVYLRVNF